MRFILHALDKEGRHLALRAAEWLLARPERKDANIMYGGEPIRDFYASRTATGTISVREATYYTQGVKK